VVVVATSNRHPDGEGDGYNINFVPRERMGEREDRRGVEGERE
jgi:hypothetical protein